MLTEQEIRPQALMAEQARLFAEDIARLMRYRNEFIEVPCPACDSTEYQPAFEKTGMPFVTCNRCQTLYANPRPRPDHLDDFYRHSKNYEYWSRYIFPASEAARREKIFKPRVEQVLDICRRFDIPTQILMEVGAGFGLFCQEMANRRAFEKIIAVEPTPYLAEDCRKRGLHVLEKPVEHLQRDEILASGQKINVIANFEVLEHLFSPEDFLRQCAGLLEPGGLLIVTCPNAKGFDIQMLQEKSSAVDVEHINLFHPASISLLMARCGFEVIETQTPGRLDAELVRKAMLLGELDANQHPFLKQVLLDNWETQGLTFQEYLIANRLSSNMLLVGRKRSEPA